MKNLMHKEGREIETDAVAAQSAFSAEKYKRLISDDNYIDYAISKIATDLSHYLTK
ncbi:MAG: hypothetical protein ACOC2H_07285 [Spirochaetota bacterium]